jgi:hypothetical protein
VAADSSPAAGSGPVNGGKPLPAAQPAKPVTAKPTFTG